MPVSVLVDLVGFPLALAVAAFFEALPDLCDSLC